MKFALVLLATLLVAPSAFASCYVALHSCGGDTLTTCCAGLTCTAQPHTTTKKCAASTVTTTTVAPTTTTVSASSTTTTTLPATASGLHGVWGATPDQFPLLHALGINLAVVTVGLDSASWNPYYTAAIENDIQLITVLWDGSQNNAHWTWNGSRYLMDPARDSLNDPRVAYVNYLRLNRDARLHTFATYTFHEPGNPGNSGGGETVAQMQSLWRDWHALGLGIPLYGESVTDVDGCANGCVDYTNLGTYYARAGGGYWALTASYSPADGRINYGQSATTNETMAASSARNSLYTTVLSRIASLPPAPDGTRTKQIVLFGEHACCGEFRTPTAAEMTFWFDSVAVPLADQLAGVIWYPFDRPTSSYTDDLAAHINDPAYQAAVSTTSGELP